MSKISDLSESISSTYKVINPNKQEYKEDSSDFSSDYGSTLKSDARMNEISTLRPIKEDSELKDGKGEKADSLLMSSESENEKKKHKKQTSNKLESQLQFRTPEGPPESDKERISLKNASLEKSSEVFFESTNNNRIQNKKPKIRLSESEESD